MWKRKRTLLLLFALISVTLAAYFEPTRCVRGWLWGEAFFDGRPTSWWRAELLRWQLVAITRGSARPQFHRPLSWFEQVCQEWFPEPEIVPFDEERFLRGIRERRFGPALLQGSEETVPVLRALSEDPSPHVRELVRMGLERHKERHQAPE